MGVYQQYLAHHGILGQKWGRKQGPPYPLDAADHSANEKKEGYKKSIGGGRNENLYDRKDKKMSRKPVENASKGGSHSSSNVSSSIGRKGDPKGSAEFNKTKAAKTAESTAYSKAVEWYKKNDPEYLEKIIKQNGGKTTGLDKYKDFQDKFDQFHVQEWDKAEKESRNKTNKETEIKKNQDNFDKEYAKAREKGQMSKDLIKAAGKVEYDRAYEKYSKSIDDPEKIHEKAKADQKAVEDYIRVNGMDEYVRPDKKGMKEKAKNYQKAVNQLKENERDLELDYWWMSDAKNYAEKQADKLAKAKQVNQEKVDYWLKQADIYDKKISDIKEDYQKNRALVDAMVDKLSKDPDILYRSVYGESYGSKGLNEYNKALTEKYGKSDFKGATNGGMRSVSSNNYKVVANTKRNSKKKRYTDPKKKQEHAHVRNETYVYYY